MDTVGASKSTDPIFKKNRSCGRSKLLGKWNRFVPFPEMIADQKYVLVTVRHWQGTHNINADMMKRVGWGPFDQKMSMGLRWIGSFMALLTTIDEKFHIFLEARPVETFTDFFNSFEHS